LSTQSWVEVLDALATLTHPKHLAKIPKDLPIYIVAGAQDPVGELGRGVTRLADAYRAAGLRRVELRLWGGGRHEMLHEKNASEVMDEIVAWIARAIAA
jgi:alpha-beta hydrolase superfamily lysophospholipase